MSRAGVAALQVAAECPLCGAPIAVACTSNAVRCAHCGGDLLVTGRRQVLSYALPAQLTGRDVLAKARFLLAADRRRPHLEPPRLIWVPYYRLTAESLCWRARHSRADRITRLAEVARQLRVPAEQLLARSSQELAGEREVEAQPLERTLLAVPGLPLPPSLGPRSQALVLHRFDGSRAAAGERVLAPEITPAEARRRLLSPANAESLVHRELLNATLALVYLPLWTVGARRDEPIVLDGVSGELLPGPLPRAVAGPRDAPSDEETSRRVRNTLRDRRMDAPASSEDEKSEESERRGEAQPRLGAVEERPDGASQHPTGVAGRTLGLRPLACPNCGWALPLRPDDVVFRCTSCARAWLAAAARLFEVSQGVVAAPAGARVARHLPVWELTDRGSGRAAYAPAFRCRRLRALTDLALRLATCQPGLAAATTAPENLVGCALDRRDAIALARFAAVALAERGVPPVDLRHPSARLLWLPFTHDGYAYCEAHTGASFPTRLLDLAA